MLMEEMFKDMFNEFMGGGAGSNFSFDRDEEGNVILYMDVPGFNESNLDMELSRNILRVTGKNDDGRRIGQSIKLPFTPKEPKANVKDGVLKVTFQVQEQIESNKINIEGSDNKKKIE